MAPKRAKKFDYEIRLVKKENELNRILKEQKSSSSKIALLFTSDWDDHWTFLRDSIEAKVDRFGQGPTPLYIISSFSTPHAFVIFKSFKLPQLVVLDGN